MALHEIRMPKLGETMTQGTIVAWGVADRERVEKGATLLTIETDKVELDIPSPASGRVSILAMSGATYEVGHLIGQIETDG